MCHSVLLEWKESTRKISSHLVAPLFGSVISCWLLAYSTTTVPCPWSLLLRWSAHFSLHSILGCSPWCLQSCSVLSPQHHSNCTDRTEIKIKNNRKEKGEDHNCETKFTPVLAAWGISHVETEDVNQMNKNGIKITVSVSHIQEAGSNVKVFSFSNLPAPSKFLLALPRTYFFSGCVVHTFHLLNKKVNKPIMFYNKIQLTTRNGGYLMLFGGPKS